jgi:diketogulonate reductase-like aldo/keto reductase
MGTGDRFWDGPGTRSEKIDTLRAGIEAGMTLIDTAEEYGDGVSEQIVGDAIAGIRNQIVLATKFSPQHSTYEEVLRAADRSLKRLKTDYLDLYQVHWTNPAVPLRETFRALTELLDSRKIRAVGVCNFSHAEITEAQSLLEGHPLAALQAEFNLFERTLETAGTLELCNSRGISILAYSPLDQGRLSSMTPAQQSVIGRISGKYSATTAQVILAWIISRKPVAALARTSSAVHARENAAAMKIELTAEDIAEIDSAFEFEIIQVLPSRIRVSEDGEWSHSVYQTLEEAVENRFGYVPAPAELAVSIADGEFLKPVRVVPSAHPDFDYDLIGGRIRYWAWVIAKGSDAPIPAFVRHLVH